MNWNWVLSEGTYGLFIDQFVIGTFLFEVTDESSTVVMSGKQILKALDFWTISLESDDHTEG
jgi:hypothetical protein